VRPTQILPLPGFLPLQPPPPRRLLPPLAGIHLRQRSRRARGCRSLASNDSASSRADPSTGASSLPLFFLLPPDLLMPSRAAPALEGSRAPAARAPTWFLCPAGHLAPPGCRGPTGHLTPPGCRGPCRYLEDRVPPRTSSRSRQKASSGTATCPAGPAPAAQPGAAPGPPRVLWTQLLLPGPGQLRGRRVSCGLSSRCPARGSSGVAACALEAQRSVCY
jgi:hypothetical protein